MLGLRVSLDRTHNIAVAAYVIRHMSTATVVATVAASAMATILAMHDVAFCFFDLSLPFQALFLYTCLQLQLCRLPTNGTAPVGVIG